MSNLVIDPNSLPPDVLEMLMKTGAVKNAAPAKPMFNNVGLNIPPVTTQALNKVRSFMGKLSPEKSEPTTQAEDAVLVALRDILEQRRAEFESGLTTQAEVDLAEKAYSLAIKERLGAPVKAQAKVAQKYKRVVKNTKLHCRFCGKLRNTSLATIYMNMDGNVHLEYLNLKSVMSSLLNNEEIPLPDYFVSNCHTCKENSYYRVAAYKSYKKLVLADEEISKKIANQLEAILRNKNQVQS